MNNINPATEEAMAASDHVAPDLSHLSTEEKLEQEKLWKEELAQIEDEIATLRTVLAAKMRRSAELKRNLGITVWKEVSDDINQGIKNVKESNVYQTVETKVGQVTKAVTDAPIYQKTTSIIGGITGNITTKIGQMRHSESFRSIEEKVGTAYENVKGNIVSLYQTKVVSRSNSQQSLDEAGRSRSGSVVTSPTIPEEKPVA
uniref:Tumor protein D54 n=1 Tax=Anoplophora glabripennis TaxID=217634 RepID=V5GM43_ANOGL